MFKPEIFDLIEEKQLSQKRAKIQAAKRQVGAQHRQDRTVHLSCICEKIEKTGKKTSQKLVFDSRSLNKESVSQNQ